MAIFIRIKLTLFTIVTVGRGTFGTKITATFLTLQACFTVVNVYFTTLFRNNIRVTLETHLAVKTTAFFTLVVITVVA